MRVFAGRWKYNHWEQKGVPLRIEVGPRDVAKGNATLARRDTHKRSECALADIATAVPALLQQIQEDMLNRAREIRDDHIAVITECVVNVFGCPALVSHRVLFPRPSHPDARRWCLR